MVRQSHDKNDYVTYTIVTSPATEHAPADTAKINIPKFYGGNAKDWLRWSMRFKSLAQQKGWNVEQAALQLLLLLDGEMKNDVEDAARQATQEGFSFSQFYENIGQQLVPLDYSETLDEELWNLTKRSNESVQQVYRRLKELVRMFAELPVNAESIPEVQQCRFLKRAMPHAWQDKLAASGIVHERMSELLQYFERLEMREKSIAKDKSNNQQQKPPRYSQPSKSTHLERHKSGNDKNKHGNSAASAQKGQSKWCSHHQTSSHNTKDCFALKKQQSAEHKQAETKKPSKSKKYPKVYKADSESSDEDEELKFISLVNKKPSTTKAPLRIDVQLRGEHSTIEALLDSGASKSVINAAAMEAIAKHGRRQVASNTTFQTAGGPVKSDGSAIAQFKFTKLNPSVRITHRFEVLENSTDSMVIGRDLMEALGIVLNFKDKIVQWDGCSTALNTGSPVTATALDTNTDHEFPDEYKETSDDAIQPTELMPDTVSGELAACYLHLLQQYAHLYDGHLGRMKFDDYVLPLSPDFKPVHAKPYAIARSMEAKAKKEIQRLINQDVLEQIYDSEMASPAFFIVKPDGSLRLLIDFRLLNRYLRRSPYYVPKIREILMRLAGAKCLSSFDANMGYYARRLAKESRPYTAFCLPWGKFQYKRLPMGVATAPDEYQASMEKIFGDLEFVVVYLDDILVFSRNEEEHLEHLSVVFERLDRYHVTLNGKKCHILRDSVDYLGFTLTAEGIRPQTKKIQAIQQIAVPKNRKELRRFLGMINYYRDMVPNKAALCAPLNRFTSNKVPFTWLQSDTDAFNAIKKAFAEAVLLAFPDFDQPFHVYADASGKQLGGIIMQQNSILACYSRSLNKHQINYTTMELELLSIVSLLREYRTMLLGFEVVVHTDHKNLIYPTETNLRVKRWKLLLSEYRLKLHYIKGSKNIGADAFSRMQFDSEQQQTLDEEIYAATDEPACVMHGPVIRDHQERDETIQTIKSACLAGTNNPDYKLMPLLGCSLVAYQKRGVIPESLREDLVNWYHQNLGHPGHERQFKTMRQVLYWPGMEAFTTAFVKKCLVCKRAKVHGTTDSCPHER